MLLASKMERTYIQKSYDINFISLDYPAKLYWESAYIKLVFSFSCWLYNRKYKTKCE